MFYICPILVRKRVVRSVSRFTYSPSSRLGSALGLVLPYAGFLDYLTLLFLIYIRVQKLYVSMQSAEYKMSRHGAVHMG